MKTFIDFPLEDLDISQFLSKSSPNISQQLINYDLFAVSNHYGELEFGHYNANCLNYMDNQWYNFNDISVSEFKLDSCAKLTKSSIGIPFLFKL